MTIVLPHSESSQSDTMRIKSRPNNFSAEMKWQETGNEKPEAKREWKEEQVFFSFISANDRTNGMVENTHLFTFFAT